MPSPFSTEVWVFSAILFSIFDINSFSPFEKCIWSLLLKSFFSTAPVTGFSVVEDFSLPHAISISSAHSQSLRNPSIISYFIMLLSSLLYHHQHISANRHPSVGHLGS